MDESNWVYVASSGDRPEFAPEAMAAAPPPVLKGSGEFLPATPQTAKCRLCGLVREMTEEHIPPKSAFNKGRFKNVPFENWLEEGPKEHEFRARPGSPIRQGGIRAYTLCGPCNNFVGGRYVDEYKGWAIRAAKMLAEIPPPREVDRELTPKGVTVEFVDVRPGAFVRAVLAAMCSVSSSWDLAERHPEVHAIVLQGEARELPPELTLYLGLYLGPKSRLVGPQLCADRSTGQWSWLIEVSHPPIANLMRLAGTNEPDLGLLDISRWTKYAPDAKANLKATFLVGFGWAPYPGDYRSSARILKDADDVDR